MKTDIEKLEQIVAEIRKDVLRSISVAGSGHTGGSLGMADVFTALYFRLMRHDPQNPQWEERDRLVLSIGHVAPVLYAALANAGYFSKEELLTLRKLGSRLQGHPGRDHGLPGIELSAGSLGQGLSVATGMALAARHDKKNYRIFSIHGDGELQEGSIWEAAMSAGHFRLDNLIAIVDRNKLQIDGETEKVMRLEPLADKWKSFGWEVLQCDGNNMRELVQTLEEALAVRNKPAVILAHTKMGAGIPEIENDYHWHGKAPSIKDLNNWGIEID